MYALDAASGGKLWEFSGEYGVVHSPAVVGGTVYAKSGAKVRGVDAPGRLSTAGVKTCMRLYNL